MITKTQLRDTFKGAYHKRNKTLNIVSSFHYNKNYNSLNKVNFDSVSLSHKNNITLDYISQKNLINRRLFFRSHRIMSLEIMKFQKFIKIKHNDIKVVFGKNLIAHISNIDTLEDILNIRNISKSLDINYAYKIRTE